MIIRRAEERDAEKINNLLLQVATVHHEGRPDIFKATSKKYTDAELIEIIHDDTRPIFVAEDENGIVTGYAFCIFRRHTNNNILTDIKTLYIDDLCVDENLRGKHIGQKLYKYVVDFAREQGCYNITLNVWCCNESAMMFYEAMGLKAQKIEMEKIL